MTVWVPIRKFHISGNPTYQQLGSRSLPYMFRAERWYAKMPIMQPPANPGSIAIYADTGSGSLRIYNFRLSV
jgi:hypothetical protein